MPLFGPPDVKKLRAKRNVKGLIKALCYNKKPSVQGDAASALGWLGDVRAVEPLIAALQDPSDRVRFRAARALGQIGDSRAVEPLIDRLEDEDFVVRRNAAEALGEIGDPRAVVPLIAALKDDKSYVRDSASKALDRLGWQPEKSEAGATYWIEKRRWDRCVAIGSPAVEPLIGTLEDKDTDVRAPAAKALGQIGDARAVEPLIAALTGEDRKMQKAATAALGQIGDARAVVPLIAALTDEDQWVRYAAVEALGQIGDARAVEPLIAALWGDPSVSVNSGAARALGQIGDARAVVPLSRALQVRRLRDTALKALGQIGDARAVEPLIAALKDPDYKNWRKEAAEALAQIGDARAVERLIAALMDKDSLVRSNAAKALGQIGDARAVEPLIAAFMDGGVDAQEATLEALERLDWQPERNEVGAAYWIAKRQWDKCVEIGSPAVEPLIAALEDRDRDVRMAAGDALERLGWQPDRSEAGAAYWIAEGRSGKCVEIGAPAVKPLIAALRYLEPGNRMPAAKALVKLYHSGILDDEHRRSILALRGRIICPHHDQRHGKSEWFCEFHHDSSRHRDVAPIEFPL